LAKYRKKPLVIEAELSELRHAVDEHNRRMASIRIVTRPETPEEALTAIANWMDEIYQDAGTGEDTVQQDLRRFAEYLIRQKQYKAETDSQ
jgi:hypothetical protein